MKNKVALVTGAARRIGAAIATSLHESGFQVALHCFQNISFATALAQDLNKRRPASACVFQADLRLEKSPEQLIADVLEQYSTLSLLVNNASLFIKDSSPFDLTHWSDLSAVNVYAPYRLSLSAFDALLKTKGSIINITDIHAERPLKGYAMYCQTKAALTMQTKALAREFAPSVRVNAVAPGAIFWPENENELNQTLKDSIISRTPLKREGDASYVAQAVIGLATNAFITGQTLSVDGGRSIS